MSSDADNVAPDVRLIEHEWIALSDGVRLSARIWMPGSASPDSPVPAILEYVPYRKDDDTLVQDTLRHAYFAQHGYASVRVDIRGSGSSQGVLADEYLPLEQADALEVIAWLASRPWCTGSVGMIGYSWGGFNGLQIAAHRPPALKAIVTAYSTDDRYADDCHYLGGCVLSSDMLKWAAVMLAYNGRPPDPRFAGPAWREQWLARLRDTPPFGAVWLAHQRRDAYWKQGSVAQDYAAIECAVLAIGGWADAYTNAVPRLLENLSCPRKGIIGPWGHMFPHVGVPGPAIGFLQECVRWWDRWLKDVDNGVEGEPLLRAWMQEPAPPARFAAHRPGRWIAEENWPPASVHECAWELGADGTLRERDGGQADTAASAARGADAPGEVSITGSQSCGSTAGVWCANGLPDELPEDQRADDELSLTFDSEPLPERIELLGRAQVGLSVASDRPLALVAVRLCDVGVDGSSALVSWGMLNLTHRDPSDEAGRAAEGTTGHEHPVALEPGRFYDVTVSFKVVGQVIAPGHRLRLALSPTYWPHAWPSPEPVRLTVRTGPDATLLLPLRTPQRADAEPPRFEPPASAPPLATQVLEAPHRHRTVSREDAVTTIADLEGYRHRIIETDTVVGYFASDTWTITDGDPLSAHEVCERTCELSRPGWDTRIATRSEMSSTAEEFVLTDTVRAFDHGDEVFARTTVTRIPRDLV